MGSAQNEAGSRYLRMLFNVGTAGSLTDGQLLERFTAQGGETAEAAFATLVERHGPMVHRVCRSVLRDAEEAHDAFQATFLVLVRRSRSLWVRDSLGPWLHQVAYRIALCARSAAGRRRRHERRAAELAGRQVNEENRDDLRDVLHDEVNRLPWGCRSAVVLCYFDGLSPEQAAQQLGCPVGTVQSRLARGRERLRTRLTRRGLAPAVAALGASASVNAAELSPPAALVEETIRAALAGGGARAIASEPVIKLTEGMVRSMFLFKLRTVAAIIIIAVAGVAVGARAMFWGAPEPRPLRNLDEIRAELGARSEGDASPPRVQAETGRPPQDLKWNDVKPEERLQIVERLADQSKGNYEKIKTWKGTYSYILRQHLDAGFVGQLLAGAQRPAGKAAPVGEAKALIQEFDAAQTFAIDVKANAIYRDVETARMRFFETGIDKEVTVPNVGPNDHRWIVTPEAYFVFRPKERATSSFLPDHPEAKQKRRVERFPVREAPMREGGELDPRDFFNLGPGSSFWTGMELYAKAYRGELGPQQKDAVERRLNISAAEGPGGRWYRDQMAFDNPGGPMLWMTTLWSPQAGYNPVSTSMALEKPDGKIQSKIEWQWKLYDGVYVPSTIDESLFQAPGGGLSRERRATLKECTLNGPLGDHQFDERGMGLADGDIILNHLERVAYIFKDGEPKKLANFGEGSILRPARTKAPAPAAVPVGGATGAGAKPPAARLAGRIFTTASLETNDAGMPVISVVGVDPNSGEVAKVVNNLSGRLRVSPDGQKLAYVSGDFSPGAPPQERLRQSLWIRATSGDTSPTRVIPLDGANGGELPIWSTDGKQIIYSVSTHDDAKKQWVFETFRINADGTGREPLKIPSQDGVQDWSSDGAWVVTTSSRNAKIGWQLYVMHLDGTAERQVTEGGNPYYVRFSPEGRRLLYTDGPAEQRRGIWVVDLDGKNRRKILATGKGTASACWSPDGKQMAVAISGSGPDERARLEVVDLEGKRRTLLSMPGSEIAEMPDWR